jgi:aspartyl-tRNA(Asn)/glutamyl-tRNA(Gln) amidotransferase subunit C
MPERISREDVDHVAHLARLALTDDEKDRLRSELASILDYEATLAALDLSEVPPTAHPLSLVNVFRADEPRDGVDRDEVLIVAPRDEDGRFRVPRILDEP